MKFEIDRKFLLKAAGLFIFVSGIFLFTESVSGFSEYRFVATIITALLLSALFAYLNFESALSFFSGASLGSAHGFAYGFIIGVLSLYLAGVLKNRFFSRGGGSCIGLQNIEIFLLSYALSFAGSYPFLLNGMMPVFFLLQPFLNLALYSLLNKTLTGDKEAANEKLFFESLFLTAAPVSSLAIAADIWILPFVSLALVVAARFSADRFFFFDRHRFVLTQAQYISSDVYGDANYTKSAESLSKALESETGGMVQADKLYSVIVLSSLLWIPFGKPLYRMPENLNQEEYELLRSNLIALRSLLENCSEDPAVIEGVYRIYENYDGSGIPDGLEGEEIPLISRYSRVLERYLLLTSWSENREPLTDKEAFKEIEHFAGSFFDPKAIDDLKKIVLPDESEIATMNEEAEYISPDSDKENEEKSNEERD